MLILGNVVPDDKDSDKDFDVVDTIGVHQISEVAVEGLRIPAGISPSRPTQSLNCNDLKSLGISNLADGVKRFAGVNVKDYGGIGGMKTVSIHNLGAHHTGVSYDGVCLSNIQAGQIDLSHYSLDNLSTMSLSVGHNENMLQTARHYSNAGTLTLVSEKPTFADGKSYDVRIMMRAGSFGLFSPSIRYWQALGKNTSLAFNTTYQRADGNYPYTLQNGRQSTEEKRVNSDIYSWNGEINLYYNDVLELKGNWYSSHRGLPGNVILYNNTSKQRLWDEELGLQVGYTKHWVNCLALSAKARYSYSWNKYLDPDMVYPDGFNYDDNTQREYYASVVGNWSPSELLSVSLAEDVSLNTLRNNIYLDAGNISQHPNPDRWTSLTALTVHSQLGKLKAEGNVLATFVTEKTDIQRISPDNRQRLSPSLSLSFKPFESQSLFLRAMWKNTFRVPTFNDLYYRRMGTYNLKPEKATEWNVGISWSYSPASWLKHISATVDAYYNDVDDKIVASPSTYVWKMANFGKAEIKGVDITFSSEIEVSNKISALLTCAYTFQEALDKTKDSPTYGAQLPYTPKQSGNTSLIINSPWVNLGYSIMYQGKRYCMAQNSDEYLIECYCDHTISLSRNLKIDKKSIVHLQVAVNNLLNKQYEIIKYYPMPRRNFTFTASIEF